MTVSPTTIVAALALFSAAWGGLGWLLARVSGWRRLGRAFAAPGPAPAGRRRRFQTAHFGWFAHYERCLLLILAEPGLYLRPMVIFRFWHPPLLIPWGAITAEERRTLFLLRSLRLTIDLGPSTAPVEITLRGRRLREAVRARVDAWGTAGA